MKKRLIRQNPFGKFFCGGGKGKKTLKVPSFMTGQATFIYDFTYGNRTVALKNSLFLLNLLF